MPQVVGGALKNTRWYQMNGGLLVPVQQGLQVVGGVYKEFYSAGISVTLTNATNVDISTLFDPADWTNANLFKKVIVPAGVIIGSNDNTLAAMRSGTGRAGQLRVAVFGAIQGAGGTIAHPVGGDAFLAEEDNIVFTGDGDIWSGGGLGGLGGTGGQGSYSTLVDSGYFLNSSRYVDGSDGNNQYYWWDGVYLGVTYYFTTSLTVGIYTYHHSPAAFQHAIKRTYTSTSYQAGGAPGIQGRGQGFDGALVLGTAGATGINNAGNGGASGNGGDWGQPGTAGVNGVDGNYTAATTGSDGALPGFAIANIGNVSVTGTPSVLGQ